MHGNVWEWCYDYYGKKYYKQSPEKGPAQASSRVLRGGSWASLLRESRSAARLSVGNIYRNFDIGFRVVRELD
jgi:formylglycine-generating enzyme required for sulfatase activity